MLMNKNESVEKGDWQERLENIMKMMRETSVKTDPQEIVAAYARRTAKLLPSDRQISLSRSELDPPYYRITRYSGWKEFINPWKQNDRLPLLSGGVLGELLYAGEPRIIDDLQLADDDPGAEYLAGQRSLMALPMLDQGQTIHMVILTRSEPASFDKEQFPEIVWTTILFGRSTHNLVLAAQVKETYDIMDRELQIVGDIQRSLLPATLPEIPNMKLAAHYQTSQRAGGDYYDFFPLPDGRWGIWIADVSGHGTPAAVMMAVTHTIAHMYTGDSSQPSDMVRFVNHHLASRYMGSVGAFVTAFYGIYDPESRKIKYCSAGHNPPRIKQCAEGTIMELANAQGLPLGISEDAVFEDASVRLDSGDQMVFYTDGITESTDPAGHMFGVQGLDAVLSECHGDASDVIEAILQAVASYTDEQPATDDRTLVVAKVV